MPRTFAPPAIPLAPATRPLRPTFSNPNPLPSQPPPPSPYPSRNVSRETFVLAPPFAHKLVVLPENRELDSSTLAIPYILAFVSHSSSWQKNRLVRIREAEIQ